MGDPAPHDPDLAAFYGEISTSYRTIDDFRTKLLGCSP
jgi:hypothetical protein